MKKTLTLTSILCLCLSGIYAQTFNEIIGSEAGNPNAGEMLTGSRNVLLGDSTGVSLLNDLDNVLIGFAAGKNNTGNDNTFIGSQAGYLNTTDFDNVCIGARAGYSNDGTDNTLIGADAGYRNTTGFDNTFIGEKAGIRNTTGGDNTYIGNAAGAGSFFSDINSGADATGSDNTAVGSAALFEQTSGFRNTAVGNEAGYDVTTGHHNTMLGDSSGVDLSIGIYNTFLGAGAGAATENTSFNTFVGGYAGGDNNRLGTLSGNNSDGGLRNSYLGYDAGRFCRQGNDNAGMGFKANFSNPINNNERAFFRNTFMGAFADMERNDGVAIGYATNVKQNFGIAIGSNAISNGENAIAIGYQASVTANNEIFLGNSSIASIGGVVNWTATSDGRFKKNVKENVVGLDFINRLRPVTYHYDAKKLHTQKGFETTSLADALSEKEQVRYSGFIAQEVEVAAKQLDYDFSGVDAPQNEADIYGLRYAEFVVPLVKAVQELSEENETKDKLIAQQAAELAAYKKLLGDLAARVEALEVKESNPLSVVLEE